MKKHTDTPLHRAAEAASSTPPIPAGSPRMPMRTAMTVILSAVCLVMLASCDESLPPRDEPQNFFAASMEASYSYTRGLEGVFVTIKVHNTYTETFSDTADIFGYLTIEWKDKPGMLRNFTLSGADFRQSYLDPATGLSITTKAAYNPFTKNLTIPENDYAVFQVRWDLIFNDTIDVRRQVNYHTDPLNPHLGVTDELTFVVTAGIHLYKNISMLYPEALIYKQRLSRPQ